MQDQINPVVISTPGFDFSYYLNLVLKFLVDHFPQMVSVTKNIIGYLVGISIPVSLVLLIGIIYSVERLKAIRRKEAKIYDAKVDMGYGEPVKKEENGDKEMANHWNRVVGYIEASNESDWRQAIIEADIMLGKMLTKMGYRGDGIGEQLQRVAKGDFKTLDQAWEAHKVRNNIAHDGATFPITQFEARRVVNLYKQVFEEFFDI